MGFRAGNRAGKLSEQQRQEINVQLRSYFENQRVGMTKDRYFEMCETMGSQPLESEIPIEFEDLVQELQEVLIVYNHLQDCWDYMGGNYIGKNFSYIDAVFKIFKVEPELQRFYFEYLLTIDSIRSKQLQDSKPKDKTAR